ncbi:MAG: thioredoxin [Oscillospiraceae bacterium]|jgi:thioredoxin 1|nr:thioredoxin [Oscillospiraceae bacterium]
MKLKHYTADSFNKDLSDGQIMLVDFWAGWCAPCRILGPTMEELAGELDNKALAGKVDVDQEGLLADRYHVVSIPTVILFKDGKEAGRLIGVHDKEDYLELLDKVLVS